MKRSTRFQDVSRGGVTREVGVLLLLLLFTLALPAPAAIKNGQSKTQSRKAFKRPRVPDAADEQGVAVSAGSVRIVSPWCKARVRIAMCSAFFDAASQLASPSAPNPRRVDIRHHRHRNTSATTTDGVGCVASTDSLPPSPPPLGPLEACGSRCGGHGPRRLALCSPCVGCVYCL